MPPDPQARKSSGRGTARLLAAYREALEKHGLQPPPGYGPPGPGNTVFAVSSFMDTAPSEENEDELMATAATA